MPTLTPPIQPPLVKLLQLGQGSIKQIAVASDGKLIAVLYPQRIDILTIPDLSVIMTLALEEGITVMGWAPNTQQLAIGGKGGIVSVWEPQMGGQPQVLSKASGIITQLAWSPNGKDIAIASQSGIEKSNESVVSVMNLESGARSTTTTYKTSVSGLEWSPDGSQVAISYEDFDGGGFVSLLSVKEQAEAESFVASPFTVEAIAWSPDGAQLAIGLGWAQYGENTAAGIEIYMVRDKKLVMQLEGQSVAIRRLLWPSDELQLFSANDYGDVQAWDLTTGKGQLVFQGHGSPITSMAWLPELDWLFSTNEDGVASAWSIKNAEDVWPRSTKRINPPITSQLAWSPNGRLVALAGFDGAVAVWQAGSWEQLSTMKGSQQAVTAIAWSGDNRYLAWGDGKNVVRVWDFEKSEKVIELSFQVGTFSYITGLSWAPDAEALAIASGGKSLQVLDIATGKLRWQKDDIYCFDIAWSPDTTKLACAESGVTVFSATGDEILKTRLLRGASYLSGPLAWSPDSSHLLIGATIDFESAFSILDLKAKKIAQVPGNFEKRADGDFVRIRAIGWSPDGQRWAWADQEPIIHIWDAIHREPLYQLEGHTGEITSLAWSPDSQLLISSSTDGTVSVWGTP